MKGNSHLAARRICETENAAKELSKINSNTVRAFQQASKHPNRR
jgi:hypothetical protein